MPNTRGNGAPIHRGKHYTDLDKLSAAISMGLSLQNRKMSREESLHAAEHLINFFGYSDRVIDNMLEPEDRDAFYTMEDIGVLQTEREETTLFDGREWRIHYWLLNTDRIEELATLPSERAPVVEENVFDFYNTIPEEDWKTPTR
ncbi:MAG: hypothetical protein M1267_03140 [Candidatus Thermoplasmatota archaeon]|nr:hypothetical protein [Candidatus Thermoplasmatota archaeon]MCL5800014.1 hypothetical protein [Candidatus Thermoplasmatota archaeon]